MHRVIRHIVLGGLFLPMLVLGQENSRFSVDAPVAPLIREQSRNAFMRLGFYREKGIEVINHLNLSYNAKALQDVDSVFIYPNGSEPVFDAQKTAQGFKLSPTLSLSPISLTPGFTYIWLAVKLKPTASLDGEVKISTSKVGTSKVGTSKVGTSKVGTSKVGTSKVGTSKVGTSKVGTSKVGTSKVGTSKVGTSKVGTSKVGTAIRRAGDGGVHTFRIPGIAITDKKTLIAVYDIRYKHSGDLPANVDVGMSRSTDGGMSWEPMRVIMDMGEPHDNNGVGDPAIVFDPITKKLFVVALWSKGNRSIAGSGPGLTPDETGQLVISESSDDGLTWSKPYSITPQVKDPAWKIFFQGPGNGIVMKNGTIVFAAQYWDANHMPYSTIIYSKDGGKNWQRGIGAKSNTTEAQVAELQPGTLMLSMRDNRGKFRSVATTKDLGNTWLEHPTSYSVLQDPVCMAGFTKANVQTKEGLKDVLFFSNPNAQQARINMSIKASKDLGNTWPYSLLIDERPTFGYSVMVRIDEKTIGLLYEGLRDLYFVRVPVNEILR